MRIARRKIARAALITLVGALTGCATLAKTVFEKRGTTVKLESRRGENLDLDHPVIIAPTRLSHILSRVDVRLSVKDGQQRVPAIPLESLDLIANGLAEGLREAGPNQHVVVYSIRSSKHFKVFDHQLLTSFIAYVKDENLFLHLSRTDWKIPPRREDKLPVPRIGDFPSKFRIMPGTAMNSVDKQAVAVEWRNSIFSKPTRTRLSPSGKLLRKTILMESPEEEVATSAPAAVETNAIPPGTSPGALRELADLEEQRQRGEISELEYTQRRREILDADAPPP
jgi:hypothetical protein